ncbi:MAG TPA: hypothetical protein VMJ34_24040 [Bryobacteraceae bacterium]|nr:hypothetical protein [Bryobacteraceae bacterium]
MPKAELEIVLRYTGPEVDDGTMSLDDLVPVLQGVASGYGKVAALRGITGQHKLRLTAIRPGSANLILDVWNMVSDNATPINAATKIALAAMGIISTVIAVMQDLWARVLLALSTSPAHCATLRFGQGLRSRLQQRGEFHVHRHRANTHPGGRRAQPQGNPRPPHRHW